MSPLKRATSLAGGAMKSALRGVVLADAHGACAQFADAAAAGSPVEAGSCRQDGVGVAQHDGGVGGVRSECVDHLAHCGDVGVNLDRATRQVALATQAGFGDAAV